MNLRTERGFGLVEILITLIVIAFGIVANMSFQRTTFHAAGLATSRAQAAEIAQGKLEDLRSFGCLNTGACSFAYQDIGNNVGGVLDTAGHLLQPSAAAFTEGNTRFTRSWTVTDYWYASTNTAASTSAPAITPTPLPSLKQVTVSVSWTDSNGHAQVLKLNSLIAGADPAAEARVYQ